MRVREREGYPLHCCVTGNLIAREGGREAGRQQGDGRGERGEGATQCKSTEPEPLLLGLQRRGADCGRW